MNKFTEMQKFANDIKQVISTRKSYEDTGYDIHDVQHKIDDYKAAVNKILSSKPQPPTTSPSASPGQKKEEEKVDEAKKDVDMKDEEKDKK